MSKPLSTDQVVIQHNVSLNENAIVGSLLINTGKSLVVKSTFNLTVTNELGNNSGVSGLVIKSDATGTGSLKHNTANVPATVERYISGATEAWHLLSSPVANQSITGVFTPSGSYTDGSGYDLYAWDESSNVPG
ncbi:MAG: hypothetical protein U0Z17_05955 [Bacteroidales bacterium]